ncbi:DMT family transporter [Staphylococcus pseudoxylosus]|uniref:DMT family transporter n=1 Tax=Staphylococcus pseudoxylosus TaxID=2282419 RepID=UPI00298F22D4|nr:DMT family transporter [Staphylococcus pseudoxylosus]MDW8546707.1 DMT family transporter [Staphylococcus pseudoxylosus]
MVSYIFLLCNRTVMSMVVEHFGWLGIEKTKVNKEKVFAVIAMVIALILIY